jgi:hypothetical protein
MLTRAVGGPRGEEVGVQVVKERDGGIVRRIRLLDDADEPVGAGVPVPESSSGPGFSPNTLSAYALLYYMIFDEKLRNTEIERR